MLLLLPCCYLSCCQCCYFCYSCCHCFHYSFISLTCSSLCLPPLTPLLPLLTFVPPCLCLLSCVQPCHLISLIWPLLVLAHAHLGLFVLSTCTAWSCPFGLCSCLPGAICAWCLSPMPGHTCSTSAYSHLCSFVVVCACLASHLCLYQIYG